MATNLIDIVVMIPFIQYFIDGHGEKREREEERKKILRYHRYVRTLIRGYLTFYMSITTRLVDEK